MSDQLKPVIFLTFPRTGGSRLVTYCNKVLASSERFVKVPAELTECHQDEQLLKLNTIDQHINNNRIFATKLHLQRYMPFSKAKYMIDWVNRVAPSCAFLKLKRENTFEQCLSYLKSLHVDLWGPESSNSLKTPIRATKSQVKEFKYQVRAFDIMCAGFDVNIKSITYEGVYQNFNDLKTLKDETSIDFSSGELGSRYGTGHHSDFENLDQIKEWLNNSSSKSE